MRLFVVSNHPTINWSKFIALTLGDPNLQASLIASFFREIEGLRCSIAAAAKDGEEPFSEVVHSIMNVSHFIGADRLKWLVFEINKAYRLGRVEDRTQAAILIVSEINALEKALAVHNGADINRSPWSTRALTTEGSQCDETQI